MLTESRWIPLPAAHEAVIPEGHFLRRLRAGVSPRYRRRQGRGNDGAAASIDGAGQRGDVLQELTDPTGLNVEVFGPPTQRIPRTAFGTEPFTPSDNGATLTGPAGQTTRTQERTPRNTGRKFRVAAKPCGGCPQRAECWATPTTKSRSGIENDYETHAKAAQTPAYAKVRREHPAIERKRSERVNRHAARHRGRAKRLWQMPMKGLGGEPETLGTTDRWGAGAGGVRRPPAGFGGSGTRRVGRRRINRAGDRPRPPGRTPAGMEPVDPGPPPKPSARCGQRLFQLARAGRGEKYARTKPYRDTTKNRTETKAK